MLAAIAIVLGGWLAVSVVLGCMIGKAMAEPESTFVPSPETCYYPSWYWKVEGGGV